MISYQDIVMAPAGTARTLPQWKRSDSVEDIQWNGSEGHQDITSERLLREYPANQGAIKLLI